MRAYARTMGDLHVDHFRVRVRVRVRDLGFHQSTRGQIFMKLRSRSVDVERLVRRTLSKLATHAVFAVRVRVCACPRKARVRVRL